MKALTGVKHVQLKDLQSYGIHYQETFELVAKLNRGRVLLYLAANLDWPRFIS